MNTFENEIVAIRHAEPAHQDNFIVTWNLGDKFNCNYTTALRFADSTIKDCANRGKNCFFNFVGGTPEKWHEFPGFLRALKSKGVKISISPQASVDFSWLQQNIGSLDKVNLIFHIDRDSAEGFASSVKMLSSSVMSNVDIPMIPNKFDECFAVGLDLLKVDNLSVLLSPIINETYSPIQTQMLERQSKILGQNLNVNIDFENNRGLMRQVFRDGTEISFDAAEFALRSQNNWQGLHCNIGIEQIFIDALGNVFKGECHVGGQIGRVNDGFIALSHRAVKCNKADCKFLLGAMTTKERHASPLKKLWVSATQQFRK